MSVTCLLLLFEVLVYVVIDDVVVETEFVAEDVVVTEALEKCVLAEFIVDEDCRLLFGQCFEWSNHANVFCCLNL